MAMSCPLFAEAKESHDGADRPRELVLVVPGVHLLAEAIRHPLIKAQHDALDLLKDTKAEEDPADTQAVLLIAEIQETHSEFREAPRVQLTKEKSRLVKRHSTFMMTSGGR